MYLQGVILSDKIAQGLVATGVTEDQIGASIQKLVIDMAAEKKITINPRYGAWDAATADVVPVDSAGSAVTQSDE